MMLSVWQAVATGGSVMGPSPGTTWPHIPMFASCPPGPGLLRYHTNTDIELSQHLETNVKSKYLLFKHFKFSVLHLKYLTLNVKHNFCCVKS